jgi:tetratricopeptide (TPR) repeat protein
METTPDELPDFDQLWDYERPGETEQRFRAILPAARQSGDRSYLVQLLTQIARTQGLQRAFDAAHQTLDEAQAMMSEDLIRANIRYLLERGRAFNSSRNTAPAKECFLTAWELAAAHGEDFYTIDAAHMLAIVEPPEQQLDWNLKALALAEQSADPRARRWQGSLYNNIGWTYHDAGDYARALEMFQKALRCREEAGQPRQIHIARWCIGRALRSLGRYEEALRLQRELLAEREASGEPDGYSHEELAECLLALGRPDEARPHFALAYAELSKDPWLAESAPARIRRLQELGEDVQ